jgi:TM2 domain-containing membrane protein YozV
MKKRFLFLKNKSGIITDYLPWLLIAIIVLVISFITIGIMGSEGNSLIDRIKNIFSFR